MEQVRGRVAGTRSAGSSRHPKEFRLDSILWKIVWLVVFRFHSQTLHSFLLGMMKITVETIKSSWTASVK